MSVPLQLVTAALAVVQVQLPAQHVEQMPAETYARAEQMMPTRGAELVLQDRIVPQWIAGSDRFWYRVTTARGSAFVYVDPARRVRRPAFDHARLAAALSKVADTVVVADSLPFRTLAWQEEGKVTRVTVSVRRKSWRCELGTYQCTAAEQPAAANPNETLSPDGKWALFLEDHNLWLRNTATGERRALTTDGVRRHEYAGAVEYSTEWVTNARNGYPAPPVALWSADSRRVLVQKVDQRMVPETHLLQTVRDASLRPKLWSFAFPFPGDSLARATWWVFDIATGSRGSGRRATDGAGDRAAAGVRRSVVGRFSGDHRVLRRTRTRGPCLVAQGPRCSRPGAPAPSRRSAAPCWWNPRRRSALRHWCA
jgi:hypothetical protein